MCQNVVQFPLEDVVFEAGAEVKSPHGSLESIGDIKFAEFPPVLDFEFATEVEIASMGFVEFRFSSPSRSILDETDGTWDVAIELPRNVVYLHRLKLLNELSC